MNLIYIKGERSFQDALSIVVDTSINLLHYTPSSISVVDSKEVSYEEIKMTHTPTLKNVFILDYDVSELYLNHSKSHMSMDIILVSDKEGTLTKIKG